MLLIPSITLVQINGNMVRNPIKTGTELVLSQISASRIIATTGVDRMVIRIGLRKALKPVLMPAKTPKANPRIKESIKPMIPRIIVSPIVAKKPVSVNSLMEVNSVLSGEGKIKSDLK